MNPKQFLFSFYENSYVIRNGRFYPIIKEGNGVRLIKGEKISRLENFFFRGYNQSRNQQLVSFVKEVVIGLKDWGNASEIDVLGKMLPNPCLMVKGKIYHLDKSENAKGIYFKDVGWLKKGKSWLSLYDISELYESSIEDCYGDFLYKSFDSDLVNIANRAEYYWQDYDVGFMREGLDFYITTRVEPYVLYEKSNGKYFQFGEAVIGIKIDFQNGGVIYEKPCVINSYTHPALPSVDKPFQTICNGNFKYESLKNGSNDGYFFRKMLLKSRSLLTKGYFGASGAWKDLTSPVFRKYEVPEWKCDEVSNL